MTTKQFSIFIAVVVILSVLGFTVFAASAQSSASLACDSRRANQSDRMCLADGFCHSDERNGVLPT